MNELGLSPSEHLSFSFCMNFRIQIIVPYCSVNVIELPLARHLRARATATTALVNALSICAATRVTARMYHAHRECAPRRARRGAHVIKNPWLL